MAGTTKLMTAGGGGVSLTPASSIASDVTVNVPSQNCTLGIQGPAFSAYSNAATQAYSATTNTKVQLNAEDFDTASCFDSTTNYRFTPNIAGYYQISASVLTNASAGYFGIYIYKNGSVYKEVSQFGACGADGWNQPSGSCVLYMNGSTDYIELYINGRNAANIEGGSGNNYATFMTGALVRAA